MKENTVKKMTQRDMHSANMDVRVLTLLNSFDRECSIAPHGHDGFTVKYGRKKLFEVYLVPTGYTLWVTDTVSALANVPVAPKRRCGANTEYALTRDQLLSVLAALAQTLVW